MPVSLSRIEREYVIRSLEDMPSPLSVLADNSLVQVPTGSYSIAGERITVSGHFPPKLDSSHVRVFFRHRQRGFFFTAPADRLSSDAVSFGIPAEIFKEDIGSGHGEAPRIRISLDGNGFDAFGGTSWPLDCVMIDPSVSLERADTIRKLAARAGVSGDNPLLSCRLFDYLDAFRQSGRAVPGGGFSGDFFYIDHEYLLVSVRNPEKNRSKPGQSWSVLIVYDKRTIQTDAVLCGKIPVQTGLEVLCLSLASAQEEDKRFLFEKLYKYKYKG